MDKNSASYNSSEGSNMKLGLTAFWFISVIFAGFIGFAIGHANQSLQSETTKNVLTANTNQVTDVPQISPQVTAASVVTVTPDATKVNTTAKNSKVCTKTGFAQKWEYLTPYVVKEGDTLKSIATEQLHDETRVNEILKINGVGLVAGSTLYLPPPSITKSSGNLQQLYGKLVEKTDASWHVSFTADKNGQGLLIPSYLFETVANKDSFKIDDCISVFLDDGYKVYSVTLQ